MYMFGGRVLVDAWTLFEICSETPFGTSYITYVHFFPHIQFTCLHAYIHTCTPTYIAYKDSYVTYRHGSYIHTYIHTYYAHAFT